MSARRVELFFDIVSPYTYFAALTLDRYTRGPTPIWDAELVWRPAFLGGVMKAVGNVPPATLAQRAPYLLRDITRLSRVHGVTLSLPEPFPGDSLRCMRLLTAVRAAHEDGVPALAFALWRHHWGEGKEIHTDDALLAALREVKLPDPEGLLARATEPATKDALRQATDEVVSRGAFGFPAYFTDIDGENEMFFGSDRVELMATMLGLPWRGPIPT